jgi:hypothetical protein
MDRPQIAPAAAWRSLGVRRTVALGAAAAALVTALVYLPGRFHTVNGQVAEFSGLSHADRTLRAARGVDVDTGLFVLARSVIPPGAPYLVATGPGVNVSTPVTYAGASALGRLFLLPRIQVEDPRLARYVISYGADLGSLGLRIGRTWSYGTGLQVAEVSR